MVKKLPGRKWSNGHLERAEFRLSEPGFYAILQIRLLRKIDTSSAAKDPVNPLIA